MGRWVGSLVDWSVPACLPACPLVSSCYCCGFLTRWPICSHCTTPLNHKMEEWEASRLAQARAVDVIDVGKGKGKTTTTTTTTTTTEGGEAQQGEGEVRTDLAHAARASFKPIN